MELARVQDNFEKLLRRTDLTPIQLLDPLADALYLAGKVELCLQVKELQAKWALVKLPVSVVH